MIAFLFGLHLFKTRLNPITAFTVGFVACMSVCLANYSKWGMDKLHFNTFCLMCFGCISFSLGCLLVQFKKSKEQIEINNSYRVFELQSGYLLAYLLFVVVIVLYSFKYLIDVTGADDISHAAYINYYSAFVEGDNSQFQLPLVPRLLKSSVIYFNYYFLFILANKLVNKEPIGKVIILIAICLVSSFGGLTTGSRGSLFEPILYFFIVYQCLRSKKSGIKSNKKKIKKIILIVLGVVVFLLLFFKVGTLFGRDTTDSDFLEYMSAYVGAQPKNLDLFMNEYHMPNQYPGAYTFGNVSSIIMEIKPVYEMSLTREVNGVNLGNVYSGFVSYYYDFGIVGSTLFLFILGIIFQLLYIKALKCSGLRKKYFVFSIFLYAYFLQGLILNFFGERVCRLISPVTLKCIISIFIFDFLVRRFTKSHIKSYIKN